MATRGISRSKPTAARWGLYDWVEFSDTRHELEGTGGFLDELDIDQDIFGIKVKLFGDAVDRWMPQVAVGALYHDHGGIDFSGVSGLLGTLGTVDPTFNVPDAADNDGTDFYIKADSSALVDQDCSA